MDISKLIRDESKIRPYLVPKGKGLVVTKECKVYVPMAWFDQNLGELGENTRFLVEFPIVIGNHFAVLNAISICTSNPSYTNIVEIDGGRYMEFTYEPGDELLVNRALIKSPTLVYRVYYYFITNGRIPWYFDKDDLLKLCLTAKIHGGADLNSNYAVIELICSFLIRVARDRKVLYRHAVAKNPKVEVAYIPLKSVGYGATNTTSKILGSRSEEGMTSALVDPSITNESIEEALTK